MAGVGSALWVCGLLVPAVLAGKCMHFDRDYDPVADLEGGLENSALPPFKHSSIHPCSICVSKPHFYVFITYTIINGIHNCL